MTNTELLLELIDGSGYKRKYIADKLGITTYSLQKKINNETEFKATEINILCDVLKIIDIDLRWKIFFAEK